jgi:diguanylate cyclase (GGDEF)-like protein
MTKLLAIKYAAFKQEMDSDFEDAQDITSLDLFDAFVSAFKNATNVLEEDKLRALIFNQFKNYGDFDKQMCEVAMNVSEIQQSTQDAINAIDNNDTDALKDASAQLNEYKQRISALEKEMNTDETTGAFNRKYLVNHELDKNEQMKMDGVLMRLSINNFAQINKEHGLESGDIVLKFVSKLLQKSLKTVGIDLIRYMGVQFIALSKEAVSKKTEKIFQDTVDLVLSKKFKTHDGKILNIELQFDHKVFKKGEYFQEVYEEL